MKRAIWGLLLLLLTACNVAANESHLYRGPDSQYSGYWCAAGAATCYTMTIMADGELLDKGQGERANIEALYEWLEAGAGFVKIGKGDLPEAVKQTAYKTIRGGE